MMKIPNLEKRKHIGKIILTYSGAAWVIIQVINFIISQYEWPIALLDVSILLFIFGLPAAFVYALYGNVLTKNLKLVYGFNLFLALGVISYYFIKPNSLQPNQIKFLKFKSNQKEIAQNIQSLAILPFSNFTGDTNKDYLSYAIHDAMITEIGSNSPLRVISKTSSLAIKDSKKSIQDIAKELKVDAVLEGSISSVNDLIKVTVSLVSAFPEELQLWTKVYSVSMSELLNVYSTITKNLAEEIEMPLTQEELVKLNQKSSVDPAAYEAYLKGKYNMGLLTQEGIIAAQGYFEKSIKIDPDFAASYAALGGIWSFLKQMNFVTTDQAAPHISPNIQKAKALDPDLAEVYYWDAINLVWTDYNWDAGETAFKKAIDLNPNSSETRGLYSNFLLGQNRIEEARKEMDIALDLDPKNPFILTLNSVNLFMEGNYEECIELGKKLQIMLPNNPLVNLSLFQSYAEIKDYDNLIKQAIIWLELENHLDVIPVMEQTYKEEGVKAAFFKTCEALETKDPSMLMAQTMFTFYAITGNVDKTLDWVEKSYIRKDPDIPAINVVPALNPYRNQPRLTEIIKRLNFQNPNL